MEEKELIKKYDENGLKKLVENFYNNPEEIPLKDGTIYQLEYNQNIYNLQSELLTAEDDMNQKFNSILIWKYADIDNCFYVRLFLMEGHEVCEYSSMISFEQNEYNGFTQIKKYLEKIVTEYDKYFRKQISLLYDYAKKYYLDLGEDDHLNNLREKVERNFFLNKNFYLSWNLIDEIGIYNSIQLNEKGKIIEHCGCSFEPEDAEIEKLGDIDPMIFVTVMRSLSNDLGIEFGNIDYSNCNNHGSFIMLDLKIEKPQKLEEITKIIKENKEKIHTVLYQAINNFLSNRKICVKSSDNVTYWIVPSKEENLYNDGLKAGSTFLWSSGKNKLKIEDVLYFYVTWPIKEIIAKGKILEDNIENGPDSEKWVLVQLVCFLNREELTSDILSKHGFVTPQGKQKLNNNPTLLKYIIEHEKIILKDENESNHNNKEKNNETMDLIENTDQMLQNINVIDECLSEINTSRYNKALGIIKRSIYFVVMLKTGDFKFYPSKFIGYKNNSLDINKEFTDDERDTNIRITNILQQEFILNDKIEREYLKYCQRFGIEPQNEKIRKYCYFEMNS